MQYEGMAMMEFGNGLVGGASALAKPLARLWLTLLAGGTSVIFSNTMLDFAIVRSVVQQDSFSRGSYDICSGIPSTYDRSIQVIIHFINLLFLSLLSLLFSLAITTIVCDGSIEFHILHFFIIDRVNHFIRQ